MIIELSDLEISSLKQYINKLEEKEAQHIKNIENLKKKVFELERLSG